MVLVMARLHRGVCPTVEQTVLRLFTHFGDEVQPVSDQPVLGQQLGERALRPKEFAHKVFRQLGNRSSTLPGVKQKANSLP